MTQLHGKHILLAVSGSIAAYKAAFLTRLLVKAGAEVRVIMTPAAARFITPLTLATLSRNEVLTEVSSDAHWNNHVELGLWADVMVVAPLTAATLAKMASAHSDSIVVATYLSARCPVFFAPAMDLDMWRHPATQENVRRLLSYGNRLIPVGYGELASGLIGDGRMAEPETIVEYLQHFFTSRNSLQGRQVLITAGPTYEPIDPVRFIGNRSSGRMGIALAEAAARRGAAVHLILGPSRLQTQAAGIQTTAVQTAQEMYEAALGAFPQADIAIMAAAVADYRPRQIATEKIKKKEEDLTLELVRNPDIAAALGRQKRAGQLLVGFALETQDEEANARDKLMRKNLDLIVLNSLREAGAGFEVDTNKIIIIDRENQARHFDLKTKTDVAEDILDAIAERLEGPDHR